MKRIALSVFAVLVVGFVAIQLVPYGRAHSNPPVAGEPVWDSVATRALAVRACFDCHSNETIWPWYSNIAPVSWRLQSHVDAGREELNLSQWGSGGQDGDDVAEVVREGDMPPWDYLLTHSGARLSDAEKQDLIDGLTRTFGADGGDAGDDADSDDD